MKFGIVGQWQYIVDWSLSTRLNVGSIEGLLFPKKIVAYTSLLMEALHMLKMSKPACTRTGVSSRVCIRVGSMASFISTVRAPPTPKSSAVTGAPARPRTFLLILASSEAKQWQCRNTGYQMGLLLHTCYAQHYCHDCKAGLCRMQLAAATCMHKSKTDLGRSSMWQNPW